MRLWHESVARLGDLVPGGVPTLGIALVGLAVVVALMWYWWPEWLPDRRRGATGRRYEGRRRGRRWPGLRWPRLRWPGFRAGWRLRWRPRWRLTWRRRERGDPAGPADLPPDGLPELPAAALALSADELAARGRYREAVRERLRAIVRDLVEREVIAHRPGWTATELARAAGQASPATATPLAAASEIFSGIWYGQRPADASHDAAMRDRAAQVRAALDQPQQVGAG